ncbi:hypothetical protein JG688_00010474, partial [Phytophthora aleatoria]
LNPDGFLTNHLRHVRIRLANKWLPGAVPYEYDSTRFEADLNALLEMLRVKRSLTGGTRKTVKVGTKRTRGKSTSLCKLGQLTLSNIFEVEVPPVLRQVFFRSEQEVDLGDLSDDF